MIAALFVETDGVYFNLPHVEPWDLTKDARTYQGGMPVVAHPPCQRWGRYWSGGPSAKTRKKLGDDDGCFKSALTTLVRCGGVLEHPEATHAYATFGILRPPRNGGWILAGQSSSEQNAWTCCVEQGHYGHPARKATWLLYVGYKKPFDLIWGPSQASLRLDEGFKSTAQRREARARGQAPIKKLSAKERLATPIAFRDVLIRLAEWSAVPP